MEKDNYMNKETLIECLKTLPPYKDKIIEDIQDITRLSDELWGFSLVSRTEEGKQMLSFHHAIKNDIYDNYRLNKWLDKSWRVHGTKS